MERIRQETRARPTPYNTHGLHRHGIEALDSGHSYMKERRRQPQLHVVIHLDLHVPSAVQESQPRQKQGITTFQLGWCTKSRKGKECGALRH
eukprot:scaffold232352_cov35-Tisochrysis_lutea.AAC.1